MNVIMRWGWGIIENIAMRFFQLVFRILRKEISKEKEEVLFQFVKFGIIGISNTVISYVVYLVCLGSLKSMNLFREWDYLIAQVIAFILSVAWSFYWNNKFVFTVSDPLKRSILKALLKCYISYSFTGIILNSILLIIWIQLLNISEFIAPIFNLLISVPINFIINKVWTFKDKSM